MRASAEGLLKLYLPRCPVYQGQPHHAQQVPPMRCSGGFAQQSGFPNPPETQAQDQDDTQPCSHETAGEHQPGRQGCSSPSLTDVAAHHIPLQHGARPYPHDSMPAFTQTEGIVGFQLPQQQLQTMCSPGQKASGDAGRKGGDSQQTAQHAAEASGACSPSCSQQHASAASADHSTVLGQPHRAEAVAVGGPSAWDVTQGSRDGPQTSSAAAGTPGWTVHPQQDPGEGQRGLAAVAILRREVSDLQMQVRHALWKLLISLKPAKCHVHLGQPFN